MSTSSVNFEAAYREAELTDAVNALQEWLGRHPQLPYFTFEQICRELANHVPAEQFNRVLLRLVAAGELEVKYRVKINEHEYSEDEYDSPDEIPPCVFDSAFEPVTVMDDDKVPAYAPVR